MSGALKEIFSSVEQSLLNQQTKRDEIRETAKELETKVIEIVQVFQDSPRE